MNSNRKIPPVTLKEVESVIENGTTLLGFRTYVIMAFLDELAVRELSDEDEIARVIVWAYLTANRQSEHQIQLLNEENSGLREQLQLASDQIRFLMNERAKGDPSQSDSIS